VSNDTFSFVPSPPKAGTAPGLVICLSSGKVIVYQAIYLDDARNTDSAGNLLDLFGGIRYGPQDTVDNLLGDISR
jgi:hypothetical protein